MRENFSKSILLVVALVFWAFPSAYAQVASGEFTGLVTDPTGAVIPNATVTATNEATNVATSTKSNSAGVYDIPALSPGFYTLKAEAQGFKTFINTHLELTVGYIQRADFKLQVGAVTQEVTVAGEAPLVNTESDRLSTLISGAQVANLPLNGRNVFEMIQLAPGAVNTTGLISEPGNRGFTTVVNGARVNMNGYSLDGISDKGLSGGSNTQPSQDTVQEFRVDTENISAEYGGTVGAMTTIVTKSGTNSFHGDAYEFLRNDKLDAREFFDPPQIPEFRMNQFGATIGGPIKKDKWFFFGSYEGERTRAPISESELVETSQLSNLIQQNAPNSVAALLYKSFPAPPPLAGTNSDLTTYLTQFSDGPCSGQTSITAACIQGYGLDPTKGLGAAVLANPNMPAIGSTNASALLFTKGQFYDGNQLSGKIDYQGERDKIFGRYFFDRYSDPHYTPATNGGAASAFVALRGFVSPSHNDEPQLALGWSHSISPTVLNEARAGWSRNVGDIAANNAGVPQIFIDSGEVQFGNYNGYPQVFHEEVFQYSDMVTISHGKHTIKTGAGVQRNYENSEFNVGRPSYDFADGIGIAAAAVESVAAGTDPGAVDPTTGESTGQAHLASNIRAWRNVNFGAFVQDDWKVRPRLTLNLGLRYDLYSRHSEKYGHTTAFVLPTTGANLTERLRNVNCFEDTSGATGFNGQPCAGGFEATSGALAPGAHRNFGPRFGFAYDVRGDGKTAIRGGFGVAYQGEIYNPLSNSRWNPPFYSFNLTFCGTGVNNPGAGNSDTCIFGPAGQFAGQAPTFTGSPANVGTGPAGATFNGFGGNIMGWNPFNANAAFLTGVVLQNDFSDPYIYNGFLGVEHEFPGGFVLKASWVGTFAHKLYRAEDINRVFGGRDSLSGVGPSNVGECSLFGPYRINCLYGRLRVWENSVNSNYNGLQVVMDKRMSHGLELHANYTYSHSLDGRSTWHSGATTSNGAAEGFSLDQALPGLDYGNSIFDVRNAFTVSAVYQLPWYSNQQGIGKLLGGWQVNGIVSLHGGFPWTPYCSNSGFPSGKCDFNRDGISNDRPNIPSFGNSDPNGNSNAVFEADHPNVNFSVKNFLCGSANLPGCTKVIKGHPFDGNLGRNTFRGPNERELDMSLFKKIPLGSNEARYLQFRAEGFNILNRTNLQNPSARFGQAAGQFGLATQAYAARQIQFALKFYF